MTTQHTHKPNFGRIVTGCPRCNELASGAPPVRWAASQRKADEAARIKDIREHDCSRSGCGQVCTAFDW